MPQRTPDEELEDVVAKAYAAIAKPHGLADLIDALASAEKRNIDFSDRAGGHLLNAADIIDNVYPLDDRDYSMLNTGQTPDVDCDLALDGDLSVVSFNSEVFRVQGEGPDHGIMAWLFDPVTEKENRKRLLMLSEDGDDAFFKLHISADDESGRWFFARQLSGAGPARIALHVVRLRWSETAGRSFQLALGLTETELALLRHLVVGGKIRGFAEARHRSIGTVRNQLKALQRKLSINSKEELLLLYAGFIDTSQLRSEAAPEQVHDCPNRFEDAPGKVITWEEFGDPAGIPVLYLHPLEGPLFTPTLERSAVAHGLRFIAPWRPYYGDTSGEGFGIESARRFAPRMAALLEHLGIDRCLAMTTQAGTPYAMAMAQGEPDRIVELVGISPFVPVVDAGDFAFLPKNQRLELRVARFAPAFARIYQKAMLASLKTGNFYRFVENYFKDCPQELQTVQRPDMIRNFRRSAGYTIRRSHDGLIDTMLIWCAEWSALCHGLQVPVTVMGGLQDRTTPPDMLRQACTRYGFGEPQFIAGAGSFLLNEEPDKTMRALRERIAANA